MTKQEIANKIRAEHNPMWGANPAEPKRFFENALRAYEDKAEAEKMGMTYQEFMEWKMSPENPNRGW